MNSIPQDEIDQTADNIEKQLIFSYRDMTRDQLLQLLIALRLQQISQMTGGN